MPSLESIYYAMAIVGGIVAGIYTSVQSVVKVTLFVKGLVDKRKPQIMPGPAAAMAVDAAINSANTAQQSALRDFEANVGRRIDAHEKHDDTRFEAMGKTNDVIAETVGDIRESVARIEGHLGIWQPPKRRRLGHEDDGGA